VFSSAVALSTALSTALVTALSTVATGAAPAVSHQRAEPTAAEVRLDRMSLAQQVGQLFMVGTPAVRVDRRTKKQISRFHVGNVMLTRRSYDGVRAPARVVRTMEAQVSRPATAGVRLFVATDQEGGIIRVLQGPGFSKIPTALEQGRWHPDRLRAAAERWAGELRQVGVNLDLAPVLDTVPSPRAAKRNPPIGGYDRQFGYTPEVVTDHGLAFLGGMADGGVASAVKHFPGLGRVRANTDTSANVVDRVTRRDDPYLEPFRAAIEAGAPFVMMSTARYALLDPKRPAAFSPYVVQRVLRGDLGFGGVVISDDLSDAVQVIDVPAAQRAVRFIGAGGDMVLLVHPETLPTMYRAVLKRARHHEVFRAKVEASALRILTAKEREGLL
jgi:beta-N-acetylhexosaminidase